MRVKSEYTALREKQKEISYGTRYPQDVLEEMRKLAELHGRSLNREIIWGLQFYIAQQGAVSPY
jgi:hypothetical protein